MKFVCLFLCLAGVALGSPLDDFRSAAKAKYGSIGVKAADFLVQNMPDKDRESLTCDFLMENLDHAMRARTEFVWAKQVPESIFLNDVLPYAVFDEPRDPWRAEFYQKARNIVKDARTGAEAAQLLNQQFFNLLKVHYNTGRKRANQSPKESVQLGMATCSGLSIILVDACRAVGIPARAVGTPMWSNERGNHTWVEIWDGTWHFTGADEYDKNGLDRGWFVNDASQARADIPRYSIYATSWKREGLAFPLVWARRSDSVAGVNVTSRYAKSNAPASSFTQLGVRLLAAQDGVRLPSKVCAVDSTGSLLGEAETKAGRADLNDMPRFQLKPGTHGWLRFTLDGETREAAFGPVTNHSPTVDVVWSKLAPVSGSLAGIEKWLARPANERQPDAAALRVGLTRGEAERALTLLTDDYLEHLAETREAELERKIITNGDKVLRWESKTYGEPPVDGRSLWISMHGGGNAPAAVNDSQWTNQIRLYQPAEGIYVAPRGPTDTWNLWHQSHIDPMFQQLIDDYVVLKGVNPNKVYLMGYSAGGDGVWQLAPRMADRFAAAAMMAGHPNSSSLLGLRNLPFAIFMGGKDAAYARNRLAAEKSAELDRLQGLDPGGYVHMSRIYEGLGHWMNRKDAEALPWMAQFTRNPWPSKIVWRQGDVVHDRFYWLELPSAQAMASNQQIVATVTNRTIAIEGDAPAGLRLRLSDQLLDLDQPLTVTVNGRKVFSGTVARQAVAIVTSLQERPDPTSAATAIVRWN